MLNQLRTDANVKQNIFLDISNGHKLGGIKYNMNIDKQF